MRYIDKPRLSWIRSDSGSRWANESHSEAPPQAVPTGQPVATSSVESKESGSKEETEAEAKAAAEQAKAAQDAEEARPGTEKAEAKTAAEEAEEANVQNCMWTIAQYFVCDEYFVRYLVITPSSRHRVRRVRRALPSYHP